MFTEQSRGLVQGGVDLIIIETAQDILEVKAAIFGAREAFKLEDRTLPIQCSVSLLPQGGKMLLGTDISAVLATLEALEIDVIGLNCSTGPEDMRDAIRFLGETSSLPVHCIPNAGLPLQGPNGETIFPEQPEPLADTLGEFVERYGLSIVGGCCGTTPKHIEALAERVRAHNQRERPQPRAPHVSSMIAATPLVQDPRPTLVGERVNSQGSRKAKELLLADDYDGLLTIAEDQVTGGAHVLDVCVALTERQDEAEQMRQLVKRISLTQPAPIQIDSTEPDVIETALQQIPGRAIVNSVNLEAGRAKLDIVAPLARAHGAALIALTIDEVGMAKTAERKLEIAAAHQAAVLRGARSRSAGADLRLPHVHADDRRRGMEAERDRDDRGHPPDQERDPRCEDLARCQQRLLRRRPPGAQRPEQRVPAPLRRGRARPRDGQPEPHHAVRGDPRQRARARRRPRVQPPRRRARAVHRALRVQGPAEEAEKEDPTAGMEPEEALHFHILRRKKEGVEDWIDRSVEKIGAVPTLNEVLLPAMKEVGDKFGAGELILPFVLQSAEVMKRAVAQLEHYLDKIEGYTKGTVVIATVFGDVHDIGKSLVNTILTNNGYTVVDLGKQVPISTIIDAAVEHEATAIGLSALLVSTSKQMPACIQELAAHGLNFPVLIGGAAINRNFGLRILYPNGTASDEIYEPGVFYCKDAFEGLAKMDQLIDAQAREALVAKTREAARRLREQPAAAPDDAPATTDSSRPQRRQDRHPDPGAAVLGRQGARGADSTRSTRTSTPTCCSSSTGAAAASRARSGRKLLREDFQPRLERMWREQDATLAGPARAARLLPVQRGRQRADRLGSGRARRDRARAARLPAPAAARSHLPRRLLPPARQRRSTDVVAIQAVTAGDEVTELMAKLEADGEFAEQLFVHGLGVQTAEGMAEWLHARVRADLAHRAAIRAGATRGATRRALSSPSTRRSSACSTHRRSGCGCRAATRSSPSSRRSRSSPTTRRPCTSE